MIPPFGLAAIVSKCIPTLGPGLGTLRTTVETWQTNNTLIDISSSRRPYVAHEERAGCHGKTHAALNLVHVR